MSELFIIISFCVVWFTLGAVTFWYMETRVMKSDIKLDGIIPMILCGIGGLIVFLCALGHLYENNKYDIVLFKKK